VECSALDRKSGVEDLFAEADLYELPNVLPAKYHKLANSLLTMIDPKGPTCVAVCGLVGRGKTFLGCGLARAFCEVNRPAIYRRTRQFFDDLSGAPWSCKDVIRQRYLHPHLLVLDEVQEHREWQGDELTDLVDRRYAKMRPTLLLSNLQPIALIENLGQRIHRRLIEEGGIYETEWDRVKPILQGTGV
jgi:DNA replication protein DnaC